MTLQVQLSLATCYGSQVEATGEEILLNIAENQ